MCLLFTLVVCGALAFCLFTFVFGFVVSLFSVFSISCCLLFVLMFSFGLGVVILVWCGLWVLLWVVLFRIDLLVCLLCHDL